MPRPRPLRPRPPRRAWGEGTVKALPGGRYRAWRARNAQPDGTTIRLSRTFSGEDAEARALVWARGTPEPAVLYLGQWLERWLALVEPTLAASTVHSYRRAVVACGELLLRPLTDVTTEDWQRHTNTLLARWSRYHVVVWRTIVSVALRAAIPRYLDVNPLAKVRLPKPDEQPPKAWRQDEVDRLLTAALGHHHEPWLLFSLGTGVRIGEARALLWEDVNLQTRQATIRASLDGRTNVRGPTKTRRVRVIDLPDDVVTILAAHRKRQPAGQALVFGHGGRPYSVSALGAWLKRMCVVAGVRPLSPHSCRHTCASLALQAGVSIQDVAHQLGHSVKTCQTTYAHWISDGQRRAAGALDVVLRHRLTGPQREVGTRMARE